ncbi:MAG: GatB/YqeY domain-containing protein [Candidatus Shapirobacteria bacterium]|nr:GatB/YqeY domain-containing protein [Candidatus Shapirobacteria bacterium]
MYRDKIKSDADTALRNHDARLVGVLRFLISVLDKKALQLPPEAMTEAEELGVLRKELKNKEEAKAMFEKGDRADLALDSDYEIEVLKKYLPVDMSEAQVGEIVDEVVAASNAVVPNFGMVMGAVMKKVAGKVGGEIVSRIVKEKLEKA